VYYDDNFGHYNEDPSEDPEELREFYKQMQKESVWKKCVICGKRVKIRKIYDKCNSCMERMERGGMY
jgi:hypothetical protein